MVTKILAVLVFLSAFALAGYISYPDFPGNTACYNDVGSFFRYTIVEARYACLNTAQNANVEYQFYINQPPSTYNWKISLNAYSPGGWHNSLTQYFYGYDYLYLNANHYPSGLNLYQSPASQSYTAGNSQYWWCHDSRCDIVGGGYYWITFTWTESALNATLLTNAGATITCTGASCPVFTFKSPTTATLSISPPSKPEGYSMDESINYAVTAQDCCGGQYYLDFYYNSLLLNSYGPFNVPSQTTGTVTLKLSQVITNPYLPPNSVVARHSVENACKSNAVAMKTITQGSSVTAACPQGIVTSTNATVDVYAYQSTKPSCTSSLTAIQNSVAVQTKDLGCDASNGRHSFSLEGLGKGQVTVTAVGGGLSSSCSFSVLKNPSQSDQPVKAPDSNLLIVLLTAIAAAYTFSKKSYRKKTKGMTTK